MTGGVNDYVHGYSERERARLADQAAEPAGTFCYAVFKGIGREAS